MNTEYGGDIESLGKVELDGYLEYCYTVYLPIYSQDIGFSLPKRYSAVAPLINKLPLQDFERYEYLYLSCRKQIAIAGTTANRPGYHVDGYLTDDKNYIWVDSFDTTIIKRVELSTGPKNDMDALFFFQDLPGTEIEAPAGELIDLKKAIHKTPVISKDHVRTFVKLSFSNHKYNLEGNGINLEINGNWKMYSREGVRNQPSRNNLDFYDKREGV